MFHPLTFYRTSQGRRRCLLSCQLNILSQAFQTSRLFQLFLHFVSCLFVSDKDVARADFTFQAVVIFFRVGVSHFDVVFRRFLRKQFILHLIFQVIFAVLLFKGAVLIAESRFVLFQLGIDFFIRYFVFFANTFSCTSCVSTLAPAVFSCSCRARLLLHFRHPSWQSRRCRRCRKR